jgi:hypothetical protein
MHIIDQEVNREKTFLTKKVATLSSFILTVYLKNNTRQTTIIQGAFSEIWAHIIPLGMM